MLGDNELPRESDLSNPRRDRAPESVNDARSGTPSTRGVIEQGAIDLATPSGPALLIKRVVESENYQPPLLPEVAVTLTRIASQSDVDLPVLQAAVERDPTIAARILSVANSALNSRGSPVVSLRAAIVRLGVAQVRDVAFQVVAMNKIFRVPGYTERVRSLFDVAHASGTLARGICRLLGIDSDSAYLSGLLHDMGEAIILGIVGTEAKNRNLRPPPLANLQATIDTYHARVGARVCKTWNLDSSLVNAILYHHQPEKSSDPGRMALILAAADQLIVHAGIGCTAKPIGTAFDLSVRTLDLDPFEQGVDPLQALGLDASQVTRLLNYAEKIANDAPPSSAR